ncbi:MAG TPA: MarR family transcriptional regulator [Candidatus Limnocylindrales bacterium]|nr:MarR family transcriptional regulator [Candidatus Limnocylindrales bacterium]
MNRDSIDSVLRSLRKVNLQGSFFGQTVAIRFGLTESDVEALEVLIDAGAATAGRLSELMGLTTGAVTRVIDRLEQAGYVRRVPDPADRRRVIVEVVPEKVAAVKATMSRVLDASAPEIGRYTEAELAVINDFLTRMATITRDEATALRDSREGSDDPAASEHAAPIGGLREARLLFRSGVSELTLRGSGELDDLYRAVFDGPVPQVRLRDGTVTVQYKGFGKPWDWRKRKADIALNRSLPWTIEIIGGATKVHGDIAGLDLRSFDLTGGADTLRLSLGRPAGLVPVRVLGGASRFRLDRPAGVPVRLKVSGGAGGVELDRQRLGGVAGHSELESVGAADAHDLFEVEVTGGVGKVQITDAG